MATAIELVKDGRLVALAVTGPERAAVLSDVPTIAETVVAGFASTGWQGFLVPAKTPAAIIGRIQRETASVMKLPEVVTSLKAIGYEPVGSTPEQFAAFVKAETDKFTRIVQDAHIPMQD
jgi:tripartite-type tricarboxylate transporter receptor subunit TctC